MELTTIAKPYANAVFEIAQQNKSHADWKGVLEVGHLLQMTQQCVRLLHRLTQLKPTKQKQ
ncbi:hypothetical protein BSPWISOXPB_9110 [uncultured Gammaproteobacteria bacterium]|nr:hypothetical protein BSPWISOXPB_9110 [uncultured Gammaproteobacteria bacterium]